MPINSTSQESQLMTSSDKDQTSFNSSAYSTSDSLELPTPSHRSSSRSLRSSTKNLAKRVWRSIIEGDLDKIKELLKQKTYLISVTKQNTEENTKFPLILNKFGWTALHAACYFGKEEIVKYLVEDLDMEVNGQNPNGWHSLTFTVMGNTVSSKNIIEYLLNNTDIDLNMADSTGNNALYYARTIEPNGPIVQLLA